jgi:hypothetical protein
MGLSCVCGSAEFRTAWQTFSDGSKHVRATCADCGRFVRWLPHPPAARLERTALPADHPAVQAPPPAWTWVGAVRPVDGIWRVVAVAATLEGCWDALLSNPMQGDMLCWPQKAGE